MMLVTGCSGVKVSCGGAAPSVNACHSKGCCDEDIFIDASGVKGKNVLVTHAHSDHAKISKNNNYFLTRESAALLGASEKQNVSCVSFGKKFPLCGFDVDFRNAGHICGSSQLLITNSNSLAVTGDFKLQKNLITEPAEILSADILLIETTYGLPTCSFRKRSEIYSDMRAWANSAISKGDFVVFGGYSTGKAQELTRFCNEYLGIAPLVSKVVHEKNSSLSSCGVKLGDYILLNHNFGDSNILIMPPHLINDSLVAALSHEVGRKISVALATGQPSGRYKRFELSDHADFRQLEYYVKNAEPKMVLTHHGHSEYFARHIKRKFGIPAQPLSKAQKTLGEFTGA